VDEDWIDHHTVLEGRLKMTKGYPRATLWYGVKDNIKILIRSKHLPGMKQVENENREQQIKPGLPGNGC